MILAGEIDSVSLMCHGRWTYTLTHWPSETRVTAHGLTAEEAYARALAQLELNVPSVIRPAGD